MKEEKKKVSGPKIVSIMLTHPCNFFSSSGEIKNHKKSFFFSFFEEKKRNRGKIIENGRGCRMRKRKKKASRKGSWHTPCLCVCKYI